MWLVPVLFAALPVTGWEYRWAAEPGWTKLELPAHPPRGEGVLFERAQLPPLAGLRDPALKLDAVIGHFELFADGTRIYVHPPEGLDAKGVAACRGTWCRCRPARARCAWR
ncbi:MAG: hypothetical protein IPJ65_41805 [Archangiaceae bacterium]|nr:hypothetical protein [Archangiaceae bacterium]